MMLSLTKFEDLSDELLMIVISYCDDICSIFRQFFVLNHRFQRILLDSRLHLLTDYFLINDREERLNFYSKISSIDPFDENDEENFENFFRRLFSIYFEEKFHRIEEKYRLDRQYFQEKRSQLTNQEKLSYDEQLTQLFANLQTSSIELDQLSSLIELVREKGASLQCDDFELCRWNMAKAINEHLLRQTTMSSTKFRSLINLFQNLFISNPSLVRNRDYVGNGGDPTFYFLIHYLYRLNDFYTCVAPWAIVSVDRIKYQLIVHLFLFLLQCCQEMIQSQTPFGNDPCLFRCFHSIALLQFRNNNEKLFVHQCQYELFRIICRMTSITFDDHGLNSIRFGLRNIIQCHRIDLIHHFFFDTNFIRLLLDHQGADFLRPFINLFTENRQKRKLFQKLFLHPSMPIWLAQSDLIFILLQKKEVRLFKSLLTAVPSLINRVDVEGNDSLLYVTLHVTGCRHRLIEYLLAHGSNYRRTNIHHQDFFSVLQFAKNRKLLDQLIEHEVIDIDPLTRTIVCSLAATTHEKMAVC